MSEQQKQAMGYFEQGMTGFVEAHVGPIIEEVKKDIEKTKDEFGQIKEATSKSLDEAKNLVSNTISGQLDEKQKYIDNIMGRMQELEKSIQGKVDMCVSNDGIGDDKTVKFTVPNKAKSLQYYIGGQLHRAKVKEDGTFKGPHIVESSVSGNDHVIKLNQKLDDGTSFSIDLDNASVMQRMQTLEEKLLSIEKTLNGLCDVLNNFAKTASK